MLGPPAGWELQDFAPQHGCKGPTKLWLALSQPGSAFPQVPEVPVPDLLFSIARDLDYLKQKWIPFLQKPLPLAATEQFLGTPAIE